MISSRRFLSILGQLETLMEAAPGDTSFLLRSISNKHVGEDGIYWFGFDERYPYTGQSEIIAVVVITEAEA